MKKLNNKGYSLVEVLAVVVILGMVIAIMIPNVSNLIEMNKKNNTEQLTKSIQSAAKLYISDYKYEISVDGSCSSTNDKLSIKKINTITITDSKIPINILIEEGTLTSSKDGNIYYPNDKEKKLNLNNSYVEVKYNCKTKDYIYKEPVLNWNN